MSNDGKSSFAISAGKVPPGLSDEERYSSYKAVPMTAVLGFLTGVALIVFFVRIYTKLRIIRRVGWDDLVLTLGMIGCLLDVVCFGIATIKGPLGKHMWNITLAQFIGNSFSVPAYIMQVTATPTLGLIKLAIFLFYLDVFWPLKWCRWAIYVGASLNSAFYFSMTVVQFYFMTPRPGETISKHFAGKMAARVTKLSIPTSSVGLVIDVVLLIIPLRAVIQLQMAKKKKIRLFFTFLVGGMAIIGSILSLSFKVRTYGDPDLTYHLVLVNIFICIEMIFGIIIASVPLLSKAAGFHHAQLNSLASIAYTPFLYIGKTLSTRSGSGTAHDSSAIYDVERGSDSENRLMELRKMQKYHPNAAEERKGTWYNSGSKSGNTTIVRAGSK